jgi:hypothetical protein
MFDDPEVVLKVKCDEMSPEFQKIMFLVTLFLITVNIYMYIKLIDFFIERISMMKRARVEYQAVESEL